MGLDNANSYRRSLVFDVETYPIDSAADYLEPISAPSNYVKPDAIAKYVAKETAAQVGKCSLDPDLCRIVALGLDDGVSEPILVLARGEAEEGVILRAFWDAVGPYPYPRLIGFNVISFDLPVIIRRSQYLGIKIRPVSMGKYRHPDIDDLMTILNFDGLIKAHSLRFYAKRFGLDVPEDPVKGSEIGALVASGNWEAVRAHCLSDLCTTAALARRLGILAAQPVEMAL